MRFCTFLFACGALAAQNSFVDSKVCTGCHAAIAENYRHTGMGRSFSKLQPGSAIENFASGLPFLHSSTGAYYTISQRGGQYYQSRWQTDASGKQINFQEWRIDFVMGSGNHVRTYLHRNDNGTMTELPLAWYSEKGGYFAMNPGYDADHFIAPRKIAYECMFCHNAYPSIPPNHDRPNSVPAFLDPIPEGIDCQRCHGPGALHVRTAQTAGAAVADIRKSIVNPARLSGDRQMEVCMQCHLQTTSLRLPASIRRFDRGPFSYRAGEPLSGFMLFFDRANGAGPQHFEIVSSVVRLRQSRCFAETKGGLGCLTCHDPHRESAKSYTAICLKCHNPSFDSLVKSGRHTSESNCTDCHMPKRRTDDVVHAVMTDHLIQRVKPARDLLAEIPETHETEQNAYRGEVLPYYPAKLSSDGAIYAAVAQVQHRSNLAKGIEQLSAEIERRQPRPAQFYFELGEALRANGDAAHAIRAYEQAIVRDPGAAWTLRRLADALIATGESARALEMLNRAVRAAPDDARGWYALAELYAETNRTVDAIAAFQKAARLDPDLADAFNGLGSVLVETGKTQDAENAFRMALRVQPDLADAQANLGLLLASQDHLPEAADHLERALRAKPANTVARCNYAIALARLNRRDEAERQLQIALETDPKMAEAHLYLGILLADRGDLRNAAMHLNQAAANGDARVRQRAVELLKQIGK